MAPTSTASPEVVTPIWTPTSELQFSDIYETPTATEPEPTPAVLSVAYVKDGNVWLWRQGNDAIPLTTSGNVVNVTLSTDGKVVAFQRNVDEFHAELWSVNSDASEEHLLISKDEFNSYDRDKWLEEAKSLLPYRFDFIPNTHILAFNTRLAFEGPGLVIFDDLRLVNSDTLEKMTLLPHGQGGEFIYSPNGQEIAISTATSISLVHTDGTNRREVLTYPMVATYSEYSFYAMPIWAADSSSLRVAIPPADPLGEPRQPTTLWTIPIDGNPASQIGSIMAAPFSGAENCISPDLSHLAYASEVGDPAENLRDFHLADTTGANQVTLLNNQHIAFSSWAPDSQHFIIIAGEPSSVLLGDLHNNFQPITENSDVVAYVTWVNTSQVLFAKGVGDNWELRLGELDGNSQVLDTISNNPPPYDFTYH